MAVAIGRNKRSALRPNDKAGMDAGSKTGWALWQRGKDIGLTWLSGAAQCAPLIAPHGLRAQSDVAMAGVVDSGRENGHTNIDANDPKPTHCVSPAWRSRP